MQSLYPPLIPPLVPLLGKPLLFYIFFMFSLYEDQIMMMMKTIRMLGVDNIDYDDDNNDDEKDGAGVWR